MSRSCKAAVIGAGAAGLVAASELRREGHRVVIFEQGDRVGGTWVYDPLADSDPSARDPTRRKAHGSLYCSLRTNLPRPLMGFHDYPLAQSYGDARQFPAHPEILAFLESFARDSGVLASVRFGATVVRVSPCDAGGGGGERWVVEWRRGAAAGTEAEVFEAVVVCNGHHTEPRFAEIPGIDRWPGKQIHSHNYRIPEPFQDQIVIIIGVGASAHDTSIEISKVAKEVHLASRSTEVEVKKLDGHDNIWLHPMVKCVHKYGEVEFDDSSSLLADIIFYCTGYKYHFPFLETNETVSIDDNRVGPLYKHVFPPHLAPWLSFVGLPNKAILFLMMELQSKWIAQVLSGKLSLPTEEEMITSVDQHYRQMEAIGRPKCHTHTLHPNEVEYLNWLAAEVGMPLVEPWREQMYRAAIKNIRVGNGGFRDDGMPTTGSNTRKLPTKARSCL